MVELKLTDDKSLMLFTSPDYELVVMPMLTSKSQKPEDKVEQAEAEPAEDTEPEAEPSVEAEAKPKRSRKRDKVAVA